VRRGVAVLVHLNGRLIEDTEAAVSVFDRGFLFGDGVFESLRACGGRFFRLERHLERLERSCALAGIGGLPGRPVLSAELSQLLAANRLMEARVRLTVTRGTGRPGDYVTATGPPTRVATASPFQGLAPEVRGAGVGVRLLAGRAVPGAAIDPAIKTTSRLHAVLARREAAQKGAFEALLLDAAGLVTEGTASNVFLVRGGRLRTPPAQGGALPGVTRHAVLEIAAQAGIAADEAPITADDLRGAEEIFLTNTSWEVLAVVQVDGEPAGGGRPGPLTSTLARLYRDRMRRECGVAEA
jgi:branched-chain amino acid aminotransferase